MPNRCGLEDSFRRTSAQRLLIAAEILSRCRWARGLPFLSFDICNIRAATFLIRIINKIRTLGRNCCQDQSMLKASAFTDGNLHQDHITRVADSFESSSSLMYTHSVESFPETTHNSWASPYLYARFYTHRASLMGLTHALPCGCRGWPPLPGHGIQIVDEGLKQLW